jgi:hypothetical protein
MEIHIQQQEAAETILMKSAEVIAGYGASFLLRH